MDDVVNCPNCGEANPKDLPFCQHCQWRLHSLTEESASQSDANSTTTPFEAPGSQDGSESVPDWLMNAAEHGGSDAAASASPGKSRQGDSSVDGDDLLAGLTLQSQAEPEDIPEWVARIMGIPQREVTPESAASDSPTRIPDAPRSESSVVQDSMESTESSARTWELATGPTDRAAAEGMGPLQQIRETAEQASGAEDNEINEWLRQLDASAARREIASRPHGTRTAQDIPSWVDGMLGVSATSPQGPGSPEDELPEWLVKPARSEKTDPISRQSPALDPSDAAPATGVPHRPAADPMTMPPVTSQRTAAEPPEVVPPFPPEETHRLDVDAVFASMQMPDWLADVERGRAASTDPGQRPGDEEQIAPANLPSWVEAMRPMENEAPARKHESTDARPEARGPLLGLHGVLPAIPGAASPSSRPRSHAIRLETSEQHVAHARLLEDLLAAEIQPAPLRGMPQLRPQNVLRWVTGALMVILLGGALLSGSRIFPLPAAVPIESNAAIQAVESIQPDAAVLAVFDYEPATAGEMEATASSLMDHLLLLKHPRLAVISSSPTGSALAERFISGMLADRAYVRGSQYVNLGFLPGGLAGVRFFAEDPVAAVPLGAASDRVWDSTVLIGTHHLQDFAAIIVITDGLESGRVWIEQTQDARGSSHMIVVSSAQAGPMLLPYFNSGQVQGLVSGLNGAAGPELSNSGLPGKVRQYWDAYSLGLYAAALLIVVGAAWHVSRAARERQRDLA
jgi:hypothetical protein